MLFIRAALNAFFVIYTPERPVSFVDSIACRRIILSIYLNSNEWFIIMYSKFCSTNLPWKDGSCKHILSGLSGIFYLLPICLPNGSLWDNIAWIMQAILSIMADYIYIQQPHFIHGSR